MGPCPDALAQEEAWALRPGGGVGESVLNTGLPPRFRQTRLKVLRILSEESKELQAGFPVSARTGAEGNLAEGCLVKRYPGTRAALHFPLEEAGSSGVGQPR